MIHNLYRNLNLSILECKNGYFSHAYSDKYWKGSVGNLTFNSINRGYLKIKSTFPLITIYLSFISLSFYCTKCFYLNYHILKGRMKGGPWGGGGGWIFFGGKNLGFLILEAVKSTFHYICKKKMFNFFFQFNQYRINWKV